MASTAIFHARSFFFFFFFMVSSLMPKSAAQSRNNGFSVEIISVDSPSSPFYNPSAPASSRIRQTVQRSHSRYQYLSSMTAAAPNDLQPPVMATVTASEYMMKLSLGSTGSEVYATIDTGSNVIWIQCIPCDNCFPQTTPMFDPTKSSSYTNLGCSSSFCHDVHSSCSADGICQWTTGYADGSTTTGVLANDTMALDTNDGSSFSFPVVFSCVHADMSSTIPYSKVGGFVGLNRGSLSLVSQLGSVAIGRFSYCLTDKSDLSSKSVMKFGNRAIVSGDGVVTTPITTVHGRESFYYLTLDDISVGSQKLNIPPGTFHVSSKGHGGLIIDSGATLTYLTQIGYDMMLAALKSAINFTVTAPVRPYQVCYKASSDDILYSFPDVTFHFLGGDVLLGPWNVFVPVNRAACLAVFPVGSGMMSTYGNTMQQDFHVGYDLVSNTVSFAHADCTRI